MLGLNNIINEYLNKEFSREWDLNLSRSSTKLSSLHNTIINKKLVLSGLPLNTSFLFIMLLYRLPRMERSLLNCEVLGQSSGP